MPQTPPNAKDGMGMMEMRIVEEIFTILEEYDKDSATPIVLVERGCGYLNLYDGRKAQLTVRINTEKETWL